MCFHKTGERVSERKKVGLEIVRMLNESLTLTVTSERGVECLLRFYIGRTSLLSRRSNVNPN